MVTITRVWAGERLDGHPSGQIIPGEATRGGLLDDIQEPAIDGNRERPRVTCQLARFYPDFWFFSGGKNTLKKLSSG